MNRFEARIAKLEMAIAPAAGRPFCIWGTVNDGTVSMRRKTDDEIQFEIDAEIASGAMSVIDRPMVICWKALQ